MKINYLSDFKVTVQPSVGGTAVDITGHDFALVFTSSGGGRKYYCKKEGNSLTNCSISGTAIVCVLDNHKLSPGTLMVAVFDYAPDASYPDGNELTVTPSSLDVTLVTGAGDGSSLSAEVSVDISEAVTAAEAAAERAEAAAERAEAAGGANVVQTTGTSTTDVMSQNAVTTALGGKQATLTFDDAPTESSTNPVKSGGIYTALSGKMDSVTLATVATSGSYSDLSNKPSIPAAQVQADWSQTTDTAADFIKNKPSIPAAQVQSDWGQSDTTAADYIKNKPTLFTNPLIVDTRSSNTATITGVAPFASLVDGQHITLKLAYTSTSPCAINLTLSGGGTTGAKTLKSSIRGGVQVVGDNLLRAGQMVQCCYNADAGEWWLAGMIDTNTTYSAMTDAQISTGTDENGRLISPKTIVDNFAQHTKSIDASTTDDPAAITQALSPNTFYEFGAVDSLTVTLTAGTAGKLAIYAFAFQAASGSTTLTLPASVVGTAPTIASGKRYECNILDNRLLYFESDGDN